MVKQIKIKGKEHFYCEACKLVYVDKNWAEKCEEWCKKNSSCNLEITEHSIKKTLSQVENN